MNDKNYLLSAIKIIDLLIKNKNVTGKDGREISGDYWHLIKDTLHTKCKADIYNDGIACVFPEMLRSYKAVCKNQILKIENEEYDRWLNNEHKKVHIKYTRMAFIISIISLAISILSVTGLPQKILLSIFEPFF